MRPGAPARLPSISGSVSRQQFALGYGHGAARNNRIVDEFDADEEPLLEPLHDGEWRVHGRIPIDEFNNLTGAELPDEDWDTLGGLIFDELGHVPEVGESICAAGVSLTVEAIEGRRITRVRAGLDPVVDIADTSPEMARNE